MPRQKELVPQKKAIEPQEEAIVPQEVPQKVACVPQKEATKIPKKGVFRQICASLNDLCLGSRIQTFRHPATFNTLYGTSCMYS